MSVWQSGDIMPIKKGDHMRVCDIDHSKTDVVKKLSSQKAFLSADPSVQLQEFLNDDHSQGTLNKLFHLLKKYDLATKNSNHHSELYFKGSYPS